MLRTVIVDDEQPICDEIEYLLGAHPDIAVAAKFQQSRDALAYVQRNPCDLVFLDINMPGMSGLEFAECLDSLNRRIPIVFVTAYEEYALPAFETSAIAYLTKPLTQARLSKALAKVRSLLAAAEAHHSSPAAPKKAHPISVQKGNALVPIPQKDIRMAYVKDKLVFLHTHEGTFQVPMTLSKLMELLDPDDFLQVHRQYVVNIHAVDKVIPWFHGSYVIRVKDSPDSEIPVSRKHMQALRLALGIT